MSYTNLINPEILNNMVADYAHRHKLGHLIVGKDNDRCKLIKPFETASAVVEYMNDLVPGFASVNMANEFTNSIVTLDQLEALLDKKFRQLTLSGYTSVTYNVPLVPGVTPPGAKLHHNRSQDPFVNNRGEYYITTGAGTLHNGASVCIPIGKAGLLKGYRISLEFKSIGIHYYTTCYPGINIGNASQTSVPGSSGRHLYGRQNIAFPMNVSSWTPILIECTNTAVLSEAYNKVYYNGSTKPMPRSYPPDGNIGYYSNSHVPAMTLSPLVSSAPASLSPDIIIGFELWVYSYGARSSYYKDLYARNISLTMYTDSMPALLDSLGYEIPNPVFGYSKIN